MELQDRPWICLLDIDADAMEALAAAGFNCAKGSLGSLVRLPNAKLGDARWCRWNHSIPPNLHECDIVVMDLKDRESIPYDPTQHKLVGGMQETQWLLACEFPRTIFDPRPLAGHLLGSYIKQIQEKESVVVVFSRFRTEVYYQPVTLTGHGPVKEDDFKIDQYSFMPLMPATTNKTGVETLVVANNEEIADFLRTYNGEFLYEIVFEHPTRWDGSKYVKDPDFSPLVVNAAQEVVSYAQRYGPSLLVVFPQLKDKTGFLLDLFQRCLPAIRPNLFPFSTQFVWLQNDEYRLPKEADLLVEKASLEKEYLEKIAAKDREIEENHQQYHFLHNLLKETGAALVKAVEQYFSWLEFNGVVNCDEFYPGRNEEDLQVPLSPGLLVVEVKGIGGTSKDNECSQIDKIKHRREKERGAFDVSALYIVNHQRHLPPENRLNPPFTDPQIEDAKNDERGLLTTYDLFKLYFAIESGFITKEDARKSLLAYGLVRFRPSNSVSVGRPLETHYNGLVGIFALENVAIRLNEELLVCEAGRGRKVKIVSLQDHENDITEACGGEIGIKFSESISKDSELWKLEVSGE